MAVKVTATPKVGKVIANNAQFLADCIKTHRNHTAIQPLIARAQANIPNFDINTFDPLEILGWVDLRMYFGDLRNIVSAVQALNLYRPTGRRAQQLRVQANTEEANIRAASQLAAAQHINLRHHGGIRVNASRSDFNRLGQIERDRNDLLNDWRDGRFRGPHSRFQQILDAYNAAERQIEDQLFSRHQEGRKFYDDLEEDKKKAERVKEIADYKIQRDLPRGDAKALIKQREADIKQQIENKINLARGGAPIPRPRLLYYPAKRSKRYGGTVPTLTAQHVFTQGMPALELASDIVDPNTGHIDKEAVAIPDVRKPFVYLRTKKQKQKEAEQIEQRGALLGTLTATEENLKREDAREALSMTLEDVLDIEVPYAEARVREELLKKVPEAVVDQLIKIHDNAVQADKGLRGAFITLKDYTKIAGREGGELRLMISNAIIDAIKTANPGIPDWQARSKAQQLINPCLRSIREAPPIREHHLRLEARKGKGAPLRIIDKVETTTTDGMRFVREMNKWVAGTSPSAVARGWTLRDTIKGKIEVLDDYFSEHIIPPEFTDVPPEQAKALERVSRLDRWKSNQYLTEGFIQGIVDEERAFRENPIRTVWSWMYRIPYHAIAPESVKNAVSWIEEHVPPGPGQLPPATAKRIYAPLYQTDQFLKGYAEAQFRYALQYLSPLLYSTEKGDLVPAPLAWINNGWNMAMDGLGRFALSKHTARVGFLGEEAAEKSFFMNFWKNSSRRIADRRKNRNPLALLLGATVGAAVVAVAETVLNYFGMTPIVRTALKNIQGLNEAFRYGSGWADPQYIQNLKAEGKIKLPDSFYRGLNRVGKIASGLSKAYSLGKVALFAGAKGVIAGLIVGAIGANPAVAIGVGTTYGAASFIKGFLEAPVFGGEWDRTTGQYIKGALTDPNSFWYKITGKGALGRLAEYWHTPLDEILLKSPGTLGQRLGRTATISIPRIFPLEGLMISVGLMQLGIPLPWAFAPAGIHLGINVLKEVSKLRFMTHVAHGWTLATSGVGLYADLAYTAHTLAQKGGIFGLFHSLFTEGFTWQNIEGLLQMPLTHFAFAGLFKVIAAIFGIANPAIGIPALIATGVYYASDQVLRWLTGQGLWEHAFRPSLEWIWKHIKGYVGRSAEMFTGTIFKIMGIIGLIRALLTGDTTQIAIAATLFLVGLGITWGSHAPAMFPASYSTPAVEGEATVQPIPEEEFPSNEYIKNAEKEFRGLDGNTLVYAYNFDIDLQDNSEIIVTERDEFDRNVLPANAIAGVTIEGTSPSLHDGKRIMIVTETTSANHIERTVRVQLHEPLNTYLQGDTQLCNTLTVTTSPEAGQNIVQNMCIDAQGTPIEPPTPPSGSNLPISVGQGFITSCYGEREDPFRPGHTQFHTGIDIGANLGVNVYAVKDGTVVEAGHNSAGYGYWVKIDHGSNLVTIYAHLRYDTSSLLNQQVSSGSVIGQVDSTGSSTGNHLHFEVRVNDSHTNPCTIDDFQSVCTIYGGIDCS